MTTKRFGLIALGLATLLSARPIVAIAGGMYQPFCIAAPSGNSDPPSFLNLNKNLALGLHGSNNSVQGAILNVQQQQFKQLELTTRGLGTLVIGLSGYDRNHAVVNAATALTIDSTSSYNHWTMTPNSFGLGNETTVTSINVVQIPQQNSTIYLSKVALNGQPLAVTTSLAVVTPQKSLLLLDHLLIQLLHYSQQTDLPSDVKAQLQTAVSPVLTNPTKSNLESLQSTLIAILPEIQSQNAQQVDRSAAATTSRILERFYKLVVLIVVIIQNIILYLSLPH